VPERRERSAPRVQRILASDAYPLLHPQRTMVVAAILLVLMLALSAVVGEDPPTVFFEVCCGLFVARVIDEDSDPCTFASACAVATRQWLHQTYATAARGGLPAAVSSALRACVAQYGNSAAGRSPSYAPIGGGGVRPSVEGYENHNAARSGRRRRRMVGSIAGGMVVLMLLRAFSVPPPYGGEHGHEWEHHEYANGHGREWGSMTEKSGRQGTTAPTLRGSIFRYDAQGTTAPPPGFRYRLPVALLMYLLLVAFFWCANGLLAHGEFELPDDGARGSGDHEMTASASPTPTPSTEFQRGRGPRAPDARASRADIVQAE
jgi:hypothetical protein